MLVGDLKKHVFFVTTTISKTAHSQFLAGGFSWGPFEHLHDMANVFPLITQRESIVEATVYLIPSFQKPHSILSAIPPGDTQDIPMDVSMTTQDTNTWRQDPWGLAVRPSRLPDPMIICQCFSHFPRCCGSWSSSFL